MDDAERREDEPDEDDAYPYDPTDGRPDLEPADPHEELRARVRELNRRSREGAHQ